MKNILIAILFWGFSSVETTEISKSIILWSETNKITFSDFKGIPDKNSKYEAISHVGINYNYSYNDEGFKVTVHSTFNKDSSWIKVNSLRLIYHEQGHFDISELFARKFKAKLANAEFKRKDFIIKLDKFFKNILDEENKFHNQYDLESNFSLDSLNQAKWKLKIDSSLIEYKTFSSDSIVSIQGKWHS